MVYPGLPTRRARGSGQFSACHFNHILSKMGVLGFYDIMKSIIRHASGHYAVRLTNRSKYDREST